jgi:hypothetical protein
LPAQRVVASIQTFQNIPNLNGWRAMVRAKLNVPAMVHDTKVSRANEGFGLMSGA